MKRRHYLFFILFLSALVATHCAWILTQTDAILKGRVQLADIPSYGHGGVQITAGKIVTLSRTDGAFELKGDLIGEENLDVVFQKQRYTTKSVQAKMPYPGENNQDIVVDVGTVVLTRKNENLTTVLSDDFTRTIVGGNYQLSETGGSITIIGYPSNAKLQLRNSSTSGAFTKAIIIASGTTLTNMAISFDFDNGPEERLNNVTRIYLRYVDDNNNYHAEIVDDSNFAPARQKVYLRKVIDGGTKTLMQLDAKLLSPGRYEFKIFEGEIAFKRISGGTSISIAAEDNIIIGPGSAGFAVNQETTTFDNIVLNNLQ